MDSKYLISYILEGKENLFQEVFKSRFDACERFKEFIYRYKDKVRAKARGAVTRDDLEDIIHELEIPYLLLLDNRFEVDGTGVPVLTDDLNPIDIWAERINLVARKDLHEYFDEPGMTW